MAEVVHFCPIAHYQETIISLPYVREHRSEQPNLSTRDVEVLSSRSADLDSILKSRGNRTSNKSPANKHLCKFAIHNYQKTESKNIHYCELMLMITGRACSGA